MAEEDFPNFTAWVPFELNVEGRPDLKVFPQNVLFQKTKQDTTGLVMGYALYVPDMSTLTISKTTMGLLYNNKYGPGCWVHIRYYIKKKTYKAEKFVRGVRSLTTGSDWNLFFFHLGMLQLQNDEPCILWKVPDDKGEGPELPV